MRRLVAPVGEDQGDASSLHFLLVFPTAQPLFNAQQDPIVFSEFKAGVIYIWSEEAREAVMLASLRSLIPKVWGIDHEASLFISLLSCPGGLDLVLGQPGAHVEEPDHELKRPAEASEASCST